jgi:uncharacterized OB-fold protein
MIRLQRCNDCGTAQYPPRAVCHACLSDRLEWHSADTLPGRLVAQTTLHHSNEPRFRPLLPLRLGLVQFDAGPVALCFLHGDAAPGDTVAVRTGADDLLEAT